MEEYFVFPYRNKLYSFIDMFDRLVETTDMEIIEVNQEIAKKAAQIRAKEITQAWGHTRPNGKDFRTVVYEVDNSYETKSISENISSWYSPETAVNGWMNSTKGHKENMLNTKWKYAGVGHEGSHWVIMFSD